MFVFVMSLLALLIGAGAIGVRAFAAKHDEPEVKSISTIVSGVAFVLSALLFAFSIITQIPAQQVGILVAFGRPGTPMNNGIHVKAPWEKVVTMDGTVQIDDNLGDRRTEIRLGNQSVAYVQNSVRWRIKQEAADRLYRDHKKFENIEIALEEPELAAALNAAFKDYNPLSAATGNEKTLDQISADVKARLTERLGDRLVIESVIIPKVDFDAQTQSRIDSYQTEIGNTRIAEQKKKTSAAEAEANKTLADSVSKDPNVLVNKCLDQLAEMVQKGQPVPAGFSCWPGDSGTSVIADATTKKVEEEKK